ncbi:MAG: hypothetical protein ACI83N_000301 [Hydrogenophaga sp.]|jgi:hypothetical protein
MPDTSDLSSAVFAKTEIGQQEIQTRSLGLSPLVRRILVLADGKKNGGELAAFLPSADGIQAVLEQLLSLDCLRAEGGSQAASQSATAANADAASESFFTDVPGLPPTELRSAKDNEMARNFMINSINSIIGQQMRISLITDIAGAKGTEGLRSVYIAWQASMAEHGIGKKRLPELTEKLFKVL